MTKLEVFQVALSCVSLIIQVCAFFFCALPLRDSLSRRFWLFIVLLTLFEVVRRMLTLATVAHVVTPVQFEAIAVGIGFLVSTVLLLVILRLRKHAHRSKLLAEATLELGARHNEQESLAYKLALHFIERAHTKDHR